ncbi:30S ribosomal protein S1 [Singulisphaera acidiphila]|uniref:Small ribosomal subunit protein bS1 n=1 Tax=Singulisphaera acidiphila (strain ATCC BAA-1392 / DSM 18658 / VKM B-2454 / MOB10) TaxID=886293 RepID=L0DDR8_SINAD|nr:30S ribosomal protein S1 [Singulisphaera acidiphila]AGA26811.1 ribosomal protein S1 [Singulisphaera acidiphila DSM 18658]
MVDRNLLRELDVQDVDGEEFDLDFLLQDGPSVVAGSIVLGKVVEVVGDQVVVDVRYKSEGLVSLHEWDEEETPPKPGDEVEVLLEGMDDETGEVVLSRKKAHRMRAWERVVSKHREGDVVTGKVTRKIKGGLLVDIGINAFLPASQVDIRRPPDIADYLDREVRCVILSIDEDRRNIVVSRRSLIETERVALREQLLADIAVGQVRTGTVKNLADFGAFVDLGGIDGLLHITDMGWERLKHPGERLRVEEKIEVMILNVDKERGKIALGLKQLTANPWEQVAEKYAVGARVTGEVVNVMSYGAFVKLESGIEGLVHISEMSWTRRINHPSEVVQAGEQVEVVVLGINQQKREISLGMKQTQADPWDQVVEKYPPGTMVEGTVRNLTNYGAFVEVEEGIDGLLHVSDMSWTRKIGHPNEVLEKGQTVSCQVLSVDLERKRIALGLKQLRQDPWETDIPDRYTAGDIVTGKATKLTNFGVFVELEPGLEGLLHISELADHKIDSPEEVVNVGDDIEVRVLRVDRGERKIGLSRRKAQDSPADREEGEASSAPPAATREEPANLKGGLGAGGPLFRLGGDSEPAEAPSEAEAEVESPSTDEVETP